MAEQAGKSKVAAGIFGILLGGLGVHNFYLGFIGKGLAQLLISVLSLGFLAFISGIWGLIEGILILTGSIDKDAAGNPLV
jgi:TM2 domain-containing membrane protein YozV